MWRTVSITGMLLLVVAYLANQRGIWTADSRKYLWANAAGAALLTAYSATIGEWVFVVLEGFWCFAAFSGLARRSKVG